MSLLEAFRSGNYSKVINEWEKGQYQVKADPDEAYIAAASLFRIGNNEEACSICNELEGIHSNNPHFLSMYAAIERRMGMLQKAEELFKRALKIEPRAKEIKNNYSNLLIDQGKYDEAIKTLKEILSEEPDYEDAKLNLKRALESAELNKITINEVETKTEQDTFADPIDEAFKLEEVIQCGSKVGSATAALTLLDENTDHGILEKADHELIMLATKQIGENSTEVPAKF